jgi:hypothetical protein
METRNCKVQYKDGDDGMESEVEEEKFLEMG